MLFMYEHVLVPFKSRRHCWKLLYGHPVKYEEFSWWFILIIFFYTKVLLFSSFFSPNCSFTCKLLNILSSRKQTHACLIYIKLPFTRKRTILFASFDLVLTFLWYGCKALLAFPDLETISLVISTFQPLLGCYICISSTIHISSFHPF